MHYRRIRYIWFIILSNIRVFRIRRYCRKIGLNHESLTNREIFDKINYGNGIINKWAEDAGCTNKVMLRYVSNIHIEWISVAFDLPIYRRNKSGLMSDIWHTIRSNFSKDAY